MTTDHTPPADQTALRDRIAEALKDADYDLPVEQRHDLAEAVLAVLPPPVSRAEVYRDAAQRLRERAEACKSGAFRTAFRAAADGLDCDADATDPSRMADEAQPGIEALRPASNTWTFEVCYDADNDKWHGCGGTYDSNTFENAHAMAQDGFKHRAEHDRQRRKFRLVRATTTYVVEAEHQPADEAQQPKPKLIVGYSGKGRAWCLTCPRPDDENVPITVDVLGHYEECAGCRRVVVEVAAAQQDAAQSDAVAQPAAEGWRGATELVPDREVQLLAATGLIGYQQDHSRLLYCLHHKPAPASRYVDFQEVTADDLPDGGICVHPRCGADLLAVQPAAGAQQDGAAS